MTIAPSTIPAIKSTWAAIGKRKRLAGQHAISHGEAVLVGAVADLAAKQLRGREVQRSAPSVRFKRIGHRRREPEVRHLHGLATEQQIARFDIAVLEIDDA